MCRIEVSLNCLNTCFFNFLTFKDRTEIVSMIMKSSVLTPLKVARTIIRKDSGAWSISGLKKWPKNAHLLSLVTRFVSFFDLAHDNRRKGHL